jgi:hypothetical protein
MPGLATHCIVCRQTLTHADRLRGVCSQSECRRQLLLQQARATLKYRLEVLRKRFLEVRAEAAPSAGIDQPERYPLAIVPSFVNGLVPLSEERKQRFRAHVAQVVAESWDQPPAEKADVPVLPRPDIQKFFGGACALCRGYCCRLAGDHAFFRAETVQRFRQAHSGLTQEQVVDHYMSFLQEQSLENSCVYHGDRGCVLPRDIRPSICNDFFCEGLWDVVGELTMEPLRGFFVQANGSYLAGAAFLDGAHTTKVDVRVGFVNMADPDCPAESNQGGS